jgi:hypothetical protein
MEAGDPCPICYDVSPDTIVCENSHSLCHICYDTMMRSARSSNQKCAECRSPMFDWNDGTQDPVVRDRMRAQVVAPAYVPGNAFQNSLDYMRADSARLAGLLVGPPGTRRRGLGMNRSIARDIASQWFYILQMMGYTARARNALIRYNFPALTEGTVSITPRRRLPGFQYDAFLPLAPIPRPPAPARAPRRQPAVRRCSACGSTEHIRTNRLCPQHPSRQ